MQDERSQMILINLKIYSSWLSLFYLTITAFYNELREIINCIRSAFAF